jgi:hypothetical protein
MAIEDLFDHRVEVWRTVESTGAYNEVVDEWTLVEEADRDNAAIVPAKMRLQDEIGAGEHRGGRVDWYLAKWLDVQERDVLNVVAGPNAPSKWRVVSTTIPSGRIAVGVGGHHIEPVVEPWKGELPEDES